MMIEQVIIKPDLVAALEDRGFRVTNPRRRVIDLLDLKQEGFTSEDICDGVPDVGRATVYRTIKLLHEVGVICKLSLPDGTPKYTLARIQHHHHTLCIKCGTVGDFRDPTIERMIRNVGSYISGELAGHRVELFIVCQDCLKYS